jgi:succinate dehydrogenase/fumarate reductase flavoprotein subunit
VEQEFIEADVLCIGGGPAGLMAAIRARELGASVVVADKANPLRSGSAATGNDHFRCYIPEIHGPDIKPIIEALAQSQLGGMRHIDFMRTWMEKSFDIVKLWDSWGIPMKYQGRWEFAGHALPGRPLASLKYSGHMQKPILTREALSRGAILKNRVMAFELLHDGCAFVALGIDTREDKVIVFQAKSVVLGTGLCTRLYPGPTPGWMFNIAYSPSNTGDGRAIAYRVGAELANVELTMKWAGPKYLARCGKATWVGVLKDSHGKPIGPFVTKPDKRYGDIAADIWHTLFEDHAKAGKGPVYMDCRGISNEDFEYMMYWMKHEGNAALLDALEDEGVDVRKNPVEFSTYEMLLSGGVHYNEKGETSVKGLYAAGDESFGGISCAATFGWIAGENAAKYAKNIPSPQIENVKSEIEEKKNVLRALRSRDKGASWHEANFALQQIMYDYAGPMRSETLLDAGLLCLQRLKEKAYTTMLAKNPHELMHCLEVLNLIDLGELMFITANERKETRGRHVRSDYPFTNPLLEKFLIVRKIDARPVTEWREIRR